MRNIFLIFIAMGIVSTGCLSEQCEEHFRRHNLYDDFSGIIKDCYFHESHGGRGTPTIILTNDNRPHYPGSYTMICYAQPGDSIIKKSGTLKYIIKRGDSIATFYPECGSTVILDSGKTEENPMFPEEIKCDKRK